jgi:hypothetical protein
LSCRRVSPWRWASRWSKPQSASPRRRAPSRGSRVCLLSIGASRRMPSRLWPGGSHGGVAHGYTSFTEIKPSPSISADSNQPKRLRVSSVTPSPLACRMRRAGGTASLAERLAEPRQDAPHRLNGFVPQSLDRLRMREASAGWRRLTASARARSFERRLGNGDGVLPSYDAAERVRRTATL